MRSPFGTSAAELRQRAMVCAAKAAETNNPQERNALRDTARLSRGTTPFR